MVPSNGQKPLFMHLLPTYYGLILFGFAMHSLIDLGGCAKKGEKRTEEKKRNEHANK